MFHDYIVFSSCLRVMLILKLKRVKRSFFCVYLIHILHEYIAPVYLYCMTRPASVVTPHLCFVTPPLPTLTSPHLLPCLQHVSSHILTLTLQLLL